MEEQVSVTVREQWWRRSWDNLQVTGLQVTEWREDTLVSHSLQVEGV